MLISWVETVRVILKCSNPSNSSQAPVLCPILSNHSKSFYFLSPLLQFIMITHWPHLRRRATDVANIPVTRELKLKVWRSSKYT